MRRSLGFVGVVVAVSACVPTNPSTVRTVEPLATTCTADTVAPRSIKVGGRSAKLFAPTSVDPTQPAPLLVSLHPFLLGADAWEDYSKLAQTAAERGYYALLPEGIEPGPRWSVPGGLASGTDDVAWIDSLIRATADTVCVDGDRVFAAGFSAGAALSVGLSCELPGRLRAVAASGGANLTSTCPTSAPISALVIHGTADSVVPITGNDIAFTPPTGLHLDQVVASFASRNGCKATPSVDQPGPTVTDSVYTCADTRLVDRRVRGMGHSWAGGSSFIDQFVGPNDESFSATNFVLDFFDNA